MAKSKDFQFNPNFGFRDQMEHPENKGMKPTRPKARPAAPKTSIRPMAKPKNKK